MTSQNTTGTRQERAQELIDAKTSGLYSYPDSKSELVLLAREDYTWAEIGLKVDKKATTAKSLFLKEVRKLNVIKSGGVVLTRAQAAERAKVVAVARRRERKSLNVQVVLELISLGENLQAIMARTGLSDTTIYTYAKESGVKIPATINEKDLTRQEAKRISDTTEMAVIRRRLARKMSVAAMANTDNVGRHAKLNEIHRLGMIDFIGPSELWVYTRGNEKIPFVPSRKYW